MTDILNQSELEILPFIEDNENEDNENENKDNDNKDNDNKDSSNKHSANKISYLIQKFGPEIRSFSGKIIENVNGIYFNYANNIYRATEKEIISTDNELNEKMLPKLKTYRFDIQKSGNIIASVNEFYVNNIVVFDKNLKFLYKFDNQDNRFTKDIYANNGFIVLKTNREKRNLMDDSHCVVIYNKNREQIGSVTFDSMQIANIWLASYQPHLTSPNPQLIVIEGKSKTLISIPYALGNNFNTLVQKKIIYE